MRFRHCLVGMALMGFSVVASAGYTALYAFGDSLSDSGNLHNLVYAMTGGTVAVPPPPYYQGRASNGPVAVEYLAAALGLTAQAVIAPDGSFDPAGTNFAVMGSATGPVVQRDGTSWSNSLPFRYDPLLPNVGMQDQVQAFASLRGGVADRHALYVLWGGANDAYLALEDPALDRNDHASMAMVARDAATAAVDNLVSLITTLAAMGAHTFLVPGLPDLGKTPDALYGGYGGAYAPALSAYATNFNGLLASRLAMLDADPVIDIIPFDVAAVFDSILASGAYDVSTPCLLNPVCDPETTLFWDGVHPTTAFHRRLGLMMASAVPEPAVAGLLSLGLAILVVQRTRHRRARI